MGTATPGASSVTAAPSQPAQMSRPRGTTTLLRTSGMTSTSTSAPILTQQCRQCLHSPPVGPSKAHSPLRRLTTLCLTCRTTAQPKRLVSLVRMKWRSARLRRSVRLYLFSECEGTQTIDAFEYLWNDRAEFSSKITAHILYVLTSLTSNFFCIK